MKTTTASETHFVNLVSTIESMVGHCVKGLIRPTDWAMNTLEILAANREMTVDEIETLTDADFEAVYEAAGMAGCDLYPTVEMVEKKRGRR